MDDIFDTRVETLARQMCIEAGGDWDRRFTRRVHWRAKAREALQTTGQTEALAVRAWWSGLYVGAAGMLVVCLSLQVLF